MKNTRLTPRQVDTNIVIVRVDPDLATPRQVVASLAKVFLFILPCKGLSFCSDWSSCSDDGIGLVGPQGATGHNRFYF